MSTGQIQRAFDARYKQLRRRVIKGELNSIEARLRMRGRLKLAQQEALEHFKKNISFIIGVESACTKEWMDEENE